MTQILQKTFLNSVHILCIFLSKMYFILIILFMKIFFYSPGKDTNTSVHICLAAKKVLLILIYHIFLKEES